MSSPFASPEVDGIAIFRPGMPWNQVPWICEWTAPKRPPPPTAERTTSGMLACSLEMYQYFADWLTSESIGSAMKSPNMISMIGRRPVAAAPNAALASASSEIGVSITRSSPKRSVRPGVALKTPPATPTSSPRKITLGSRSSSSAIASRIATRNSSVLMTRTPSRRSSAGSG